MFNHPRVPVLDVDFLRRWTPVRVMLAGLIFYVAATISSPLIYDLNVVTWRAAIYLAASILAFFAGCYVATFIVAGSGQPMEPQPFTVPLDRYINATIVIGAISILMRVYDRFVLRGFTVEETFFETRETLSVNVSVFGYLGGPGFCFGLIALTLIWLSAGQKRRPATFVVACAMSSYPVVEGLLQGSRSSMLHAGFMVFFFARSTRAMRWLFGSKLAMAGAVLAFLAIFRILYEMRTLEANNYNETIFEVYHLSSMSRFADVPSWITNIVLQNDTRDVLSNLLMTWVHFEQHLTHSWVVYFANFENMADDAGLGWGRMHFYVPTRILSLIAGADLSYNAGEAGLLEGLFGTSFSYLYYDFGALGPLASALFGMLTTFVHAWAIRLPERWLPLYAMFVIAIAMCMIDNQLVGGLGVFAFWGYLLYAGLHAIMSALSRRIFSHGSTEPRPAVGHRSAHLL
jgi:hypothetical protein